MLGRDGLRRVARERHRALLAGRVEQHGQLERREVLHLVDHEVLVRERPLGALQRAALELVDAQQERVVLGVEGEALAVVLELAARAQAIARDAPAVHVVELAVGEDAGRVLREAGAQRLAIGEQRGPLARDVARARAQRAAHVLERRARRGLERGVAHPASRRP